MLFTALINLIISLINALDISLPSFPNDVAGSLVTFASYLPGALGLLRSFLGDEVFLQISILFSLFVDLQAFKFAWSFFWWIIKKIPILNIS